MSYGAVTIFSASMASGGDSASVNLGKSWAKVSLQVGTMSTGVQLVQYASVDNTSFYQVFNVVGNTATVAANTFSVVDTVGTNGGIVPLVPGFQYMKVIGTGVVSGGVIFKFICAE
jgi:hypothetical protein